MDASVVTGFLMVLTLAGAVLAVSLTNILHAIFGLAVALLGIAGLFLVLNSPFVAAMEVLIYIGGISVAMIFAVMLSSVVSKKTRESTTRRVLGLLVAGVFFAGVSLVITSTDFGFRTGVVPDGAWDVKRIGENLLDRFNVVFEALSVVLLLAIIGAIVISKRKEAGQ